MAFYFRALDGRGCSFHHGGFAFSILRFRWRTGLTRERQEGGDDRKRQTPSHSKFKEPERFTRHFAWDLTVLTVERQVTRSRISRTGAQAASKPSAEGARGSGAAEYFFDTCCGWHAALKPEQGAYVAT